MGWFSVFGYDCGKETCHCLHIFTKVFYAPKGGFEIIILFFPGQWVAGVSLGLWEMEAENGSPCRWFKKYLKQTPDSLIQRPSLFFDELRSEMLGATSR